MTNRPKLKIALTTTDKILEIAGALTVVVLWAVAIINYTTLPAEIPIHFNLSGQADNYGAKGIIFALPIIGTIEFVLLTILNKYPHTFNYLTTITTDNALRQYTIATRLIRYLKFVIGLIFLLIVIKMVQTVKGNSEGLGVWFLPLMPSLIFIPLLYAIFNIRK